MAGDFNAKSKLWFNEHTDNSGAKVEEFITENDLIVLNQDNNPPTFWTTNGQSNIDLTIVTRDLQNHVKSWRVIQDWTNSDHNGIYFSLQLTNESLPPRRVTKGERYNIKTANWEKFSTSLHKEISNDMLDELKAANSEECVRLMDEAIHRACKGSIKRRTKVERKVPWWSRDLRMLRKKVTDCKKRLQRFRRMNRANDADAERIKYAKLKRSYNYQIRKAKTSSWQNFVTEVANKDPWGVVYKTITGKRTSADIMHTICIGPSYTTDWVSSINVLLRTLAPDDENTEREDLSLETNGFTQEHTNYSLEAEISLQEISEALAKTKDKKAPGMDNINPEILKQVWRHNPQVLKILYNNAFNQEKFPKTWKSANMIIFLKSKDRDPSIAGSYRPVSLLSVVGKTYERIIANRLTRNYNEAGLASDSQYGFKKGKSTEDALYDMRLHVKTINRKYLLGVFFDIKGAFDNLRWKSILDRILLTNCSRQLFNIIKDYFTDREIVIKAGTDVITKKMTRGCPQGSILGPIMWNFVLDEFLNNKTENCEYIAYADDLLVMISGNSRNELEHYARNVLQKLSNWTKTNKLEISTEKTKAIMLKGNFNKDRLPNIKFNEDKIKYHDSVKYLGVIIDKQLNFVQHAKNIKEKVKSVCAKFKRIARDTWGLNSKSLHLIYKCLIIPIFTYAAGAWYDQTRHTHVRRQLDSAQRFALLTISKATRRVSTVALQVLTGKAPIDLTITERGIQYTIRTRRIIDTELYTTPLNIGDMDNKGIASEKRKINVKITNTWQDRWDEETKGKTTKLFIPKVTYHESSKGWFNPGRNLTYILTNHGPFNNGLYKLGNSQTANCEICINEELIEDFSHVLHTCSGYEELRDKLDLRTILDQVETTMQYNQLIINKNIYNKIKVLAEQIFNTRKLLTARSRNGPPPRGRDGNVLSLTEHGQVTDNERQEQDNEHKQTQENEIPNN